MIRSTSGTAYFNHAESKAIGTAQIAVKAKVIDTLFDHTLSLQQHNESPIGFNKEHAPKKYTQTYYQESIINHLKEFLLKYTVVSSLYKYLREEKIMFVGEPRLTNINVHQHQDAIYAFEYTVAPKIAVRDWRYLPFKSPVRKKYQDIDKQASLFIEQESTAKKEYKQHLIAPGDWVLFEVSIANEKNKPLVNDLCELLWIQISDEDAGEPLRALFVGHSKGDTFITNNLYLQEYFGGTINTYYTFSVSIKEVIPTAYFCLDLFKDHFKLKSIRKMHQKIVEVYSSRTDISLRRAIVEEALALLAKTYPFDVPTPAIMRQEHIILERLHESPDYAVYKLQSDFEKSVQELARKQLRESMLADYFAHQENITPTIKDTCQYLNFTQRPRTKEFIYFMHPAISTNEDEEPIPHELLQYFCRKEKTINHILYHWSKP